jgi:TolB protein
MRYGFIALLGALALSSLACNDLGIDGGGGPGGGFVFTSGYVYVRPDSRDVYIVDSSAPSAPQQLTSNGGNHTPSISPDGNTVVFVHDTGPGLKEIDVVPTTGTGTPSAIFSGGAAYANLRDPVISPSGTTVAFVYDQNNISFVATVGIDGSNVVTVTESNAGLSFGSPSWNPSNGFLLVASGSAPNDLTQVEEINLSTQEMSTSLSLGGPVVDRVVISPDGQSAVFNAIGSDARARIFTLDLNNGSVAQITDHPGDESASDGFPAWVGNTQVTFNSDSGGAQQVYVTGVAPTVPTAGSLAVPSAVEPWFH